MRPVVDDDGARAVTDGWTPVVAGGAASPDDTARARSVAAATAEELANVRAAAAKWQTALAGLSGGITVFSLLKDRSTVAGLASPFGVVAGALLGLALLTSVAAGVFAMRAAFGLPRLVRTATWRSTADDHSQAHQAQQLLKAAIGGTVLTLVLLGATLAVTWYAPTAAPGLRVRSPDGKSICGEVVRVGAGAVALKTDTGEQTVPLADAQGLQPVASCTASG